MSAATSRLDLMGLLPDELSLVLRGLEQPDYRARQVFAWLHRGASFEEMTDLPQALRGRLAEVASPGTLQLANKEVARDGATRLAFRAADDQIIESVLLPHPGRTTVCVSSQIGCAYGCQFCATGAQGLTRSLTAGEIADQVVRVQLVLRGVAQAARAGRITNVVFMGMGEPLANYEAVVKAMRLLNHPGGLNISARHIAISTCGLPEQIRRLAGEGLPVALAISLHAATDEVRSQLLPINRTHPIAAVIAAARCYAERTGRKVAFQYLVVPGVNDSEEQAGRLAALVRGFPAMVNLIPRNPVDGFGAPDARAALRFAGWLERRGVPVVVRKSRGAEVLGACGQLRGRLAGQSKAGRARARPAKDLS